MHLAKIQIPGGGGEVKRFFFEVIKISIHGTWVQGLGARAPSAKQGLR